MKTRPRTGQLLVGGNLFSSLSHPKHPAPWLLEDDPSAFLYDINKLRKCGGEFVTTYLLGALEDSLGDFLFSIPLSEGENSIPLGDISVLFLPPTWKWSEAIFLAIINIEKDLSYLAGEVRSIVPWSRRKFHEILVKNIFERIDTLEAEYAKYRSNKVNALLSKQILYLTYVHTQVEVSLRGERAYIE